MKTFALKTRKRSVVKSMSSKSAVAKRGRSGAVRRRTVDCRHDEPVRGVWDDRGGPEDSNARSSPPSPKHKADQNREASRRL